MAQTSKNIKICMDNSIIQWDTDSDGDVKPYSLLWNTIEDEGHTENGSFVRRSDEPLDVRSLHGVRLSTCCIDEGKCHFSTADNNIQE